MALAPGKLMRTLTILTLTCACLLGTSLTAQAEEKFGPSERNDPSIIAYGFEGLATGAFVGLGIGYLVARDEDFERSDWRAIGLGGGVGALSGMALGLGLGAADLASDRPGVGGIVLRDTLYGTGLGSVAGLLSGGISAIVAEDPEHAVFGTAIGAVAGAGVGMIVGLIEGPRMVNSRRHQARFAPTVMAARDDSNRSVYMPGIAGRF
jgi:hypothetical protein